ncbi:MAG: hypothetical protein AB8G23_01055 [Myxococcota bacterium]
MSDRAKIESKAPSSAEAEGYPIGKIVIGIVWLFSTACFFPPLSAASFAGFGRTLFGVLAVVHLVECIAFLGVLKKSPRPLMEELWQTFLFGIVHVSIIRREIAARDGSAS